MNRPKKQPEVIAPAKKSKKMIAARKYIKFLNVFGIFNKDMLLSILPFILFLMVIALTYIANSYQAERTIREIDGISKELKTLRTEYITGKSELMFVSKQSEVARLVEPQGIKESVEAPVKIMIESTENKK